MEDKKYTPILPFDGTLADNFMIYDNVTYVCRIDRSSPDSPVKLHHDSMIKYYSYGYSQEPVKIGGDNVEEDMLSLTDGYEDEMNF